ncbi:MAG: DHA2 family efflux MFS transporter permease subunit [Sphingomonadales bacterium]|nr:DHA2 family efflux MFS transporter permease subunit [Sphingomonadales bacterium]MDE2568464.1 DHA2 family efflux MFS transporter permease subunit [Sphingomonadales bacterium]
MSGRTDQTAGDWEDDQLAPPTIEVAPLQVENRGLLIIFVMAAMVMQMLDTTIANVALPHMESTLGATQETVTWVLTSYVLASAITLPLSGWLVDTFGVKRILILSVASFTAASALCGVAQSLNQMVLFRVMQGLAGAFLSPLAQTIMLDTSTPAERPRQMAIYTQGVMLGPIAGPVLGGWITENYTWRWVFFINVPIGIIAIFGLLLLLPDTPRRHRKFDIPGWIFIALGLASFQLMLDRGSTKDWFDSGEIVTYAVIAACSFWMMIVHFVTARNPLFPRDMFLDRNFVGSLLLFFLVGMVMMAVLALLPGLLQTIYGYPAVDAGMLLAPRGIGMLISVTLFNKQINKIDPRFALTLGLGLVGWSLWLMSRWSPDMPMAPIFITGMIQGVGLSFTFIPITLLAFATLPPRYRADASAMNNLFRNVGSSIGITICSVLLARNLQLNHAEIGSALRIPAMPFALDRVTAYGEASDAVMQVLDGMVNKQAAMLAYLDDFLLMAMLCFFAIPFLYLLKASKPGAPHSASAAADAAGH